MSTADDRSAVEYRDLGAIGHPDFRVGDDGSVWSMRSERGRQRLEDWRRLNAAPNAQGYPQVNLDDRIWTVHALVLTAFVGPRPEGMECRHLDGLRTNCRLDNLCWGTSVENSADQRRHGTLTGGSLPGDSSPTAKLTGASVRSIASLLLEGHSTLKLAEVFEISQPTVSAIKVGRIWSHLFPADYLKQLREKRYQKGECNANRYRSVAHVCLAV